MSEYNATGSKSFECNAALSRFQRVKLVAGKLEVAGADETAIGFVDGAVGAYPTTIGDTVTVRLLTSSGTFKAIASEAVAVSAILYGAASGKVTDTDGGSYTARFLALSAGSADGSIIEVLPLTLS